MHMNELLSKSQTQPASVADAAALANTRLRQAALVAAVLIIIGAIAGLVPRWQRRAALRQETRALAITSVSVVSPTPSKPSGSLFLPAEIRPFLEAPIYARASGYLKHWYFDIGSHVKAGELLAEIESPEVDQELDQARAQLVQAEAALALAKTTAARWADLLKTASVSEQEAAEKDADFKLKAASVEAAHANVHRLEDLQGFEKVIAPFDGLVTVRATDIGELIVAGGGKELFRLAQTGKLRVFVHVPQSAARGVSPGQNAELSLPEIPGRTFPAKVVRTSGAMNADSRTLLVELEVDNSKGEILSGGYAEVQFHDLKEEPVLTLPSNTLLFRSEGTQIGVVDASGKVILRSVVLGRDFGPTVEIVKGLEPSDQVILNPPDSLVSGAQVHVLKK